MAGFFVFIGIVLILVGGLMIFLRWRPYNQLIRNSNEGYGRRFADREDSSSTKIKQPKYTLGVTLAAVGLGILVMLMFGIIAVVGPNEIGVLENSATGRFTVLNPGTYIWPFSGNAPFVTSVKNYTLINQVVEVGRSPAQKEGIQGDSNSPGRPVVYIVAKAWVHVNKDQILQLHRLYGQSYVQSWLNGVLQDAVKTVQGKNPYDYIGSNRGQFELDVTTEFQNRLLNNENEDKQQLIVVSQVQIIDWDLSEQMNQNLEAVIAKTNEAKTAGQQEEINLRNQAAAIVQSQTEYNITKKKAEADAEKLKLEAGAQAAATRLKADADAYAVAAKYKAESDGIKQIQQALSSIPDGYKLYLMYQSWNGDLPDYLTSGAVIPFIDINSPTPTATPAPTK